MDQELIIPEDTSSKNTELLGIEIFAAGDYEEKGKYEISDLQIIAANYDPNFLECPATLDHEYWGQAFGWVSRLYVEGSKLVADFKDVVPELLTLLQTKRYKKRSVELYTNLKDKGPYLRAVTFLGAASPHAKGLKDIFAEEGKKVIRFADSEYRTIDIFDMDGGTDMDPVKDDKTKATENKLEMSIEVSSEAFSKQIADAKAEVTKMAAELEAEKKIFAESKRAHEEVQALAIFDAAFEKKLREGSITPAEREIELALFTNGENKLVTFAGESVSYRALLLKSLDARQPVIVTDKSPFVSNADALPSQGEDDQEAFSTEVREYRAKNPHASREVAIATVLDRGKKGKAQKSK